METLPNEIFDMIWKLTCTHDDVIALQWTKDRHITPQSSDSSGSRLDNYLNISQTCWKVRKVVSETFYRDNEFHLNGDCYEIFQILDKMPREARSLLRSVEIGGKAMFEHDDTRLSLGFEELINTIFNDMSLNTLTIAWSRNDPDTNNEFLCSWYTATLLALMDGRISRLQFSSRNGFRWEREPLFLDILYTYGDLLKDHTLSHSSEVFGTTRWDNLEEKVKTAAITILKQHTDLYPLRYSTKRAEDGPRTLIKFGYLALSKINAIPGHELNVEQLDAYDEIVFSAGIKDFLPWGERHKQVAAAYCLVRKLDCFLTRYKNDESPWHSGLFRYSDDPIIEERYLKHFWAQLDKV